MHSPVGHGHPQQGHRVGNPLSHGGQTRGGCHRTRRPDHPCGARYGRGHRLPCTHTGTPTAVQAAGQHRAKPHTACAPGTGQSMEIGAGPTKIRHAHICHRQRGGTCAGTCEPAPGQPCGASGAQTDAGRDGHLAPQKYQWRVRLELPEACADTGQAHTMPGRRVPKLLPDMQVWPQDKHPLLPTSAPPGALKNLLTDPKPLAWDPMGIVYTDGSVIKLGSGDADEDAGEGPPPPGIGAGVYVPAHLSRGVGATPTATAVEVAILPTRWPSSQTRPASRNPTQSTEPSCVPSTPQYAWGTSYCHR